MQESAAPIQPNFAFNDTFRQLPPPSPSLGNFADQLSAFGQPAAPAPAQGPFNLGNWSERLSADGGGGKLGGVTEQIARAAGTALKGTAAAMSQRPAQRRAPTQEARAHAVKRFSLSDYLAALSSDPGRARL